MMVDTHQSQQPGLPPQQPERRNLNVYDASLQRGLTRLDINHSTPPRDGAGKWASEVNNAMRLAQVEQGRPTVRFEGQHPPSASYTTTSVPSGPLHQYTMSAPSGSTPRESKRRGWYNGPVTIHREEGSRTPQDSQDPRVARVERMVHPNFDGFSGFPVREQGPPPAQQPQQSQEQRPSRAESFGPLDALVAVATSEGSTAAAY
jgi:C2H2 transcription facotor